MSLVRSIRTAGCLAVLASASSAFASEFSLSALPPTEETTPIYASDASAEAPLTSPDYLASSADYQPLMRALDRFGLAEPLDNLGIQLYGFVQVSYTYNTTDPRQDDALGPDPARHRIQGRMFDHHSNRLSVNRLDLFAQRTVNYRKGEFDIGFMLEQQYGIDAAMMHSNGLFDYDFPSYINHADPEYQYDLTQAYVDFALPVGTGMRLRAGKFLTLLGYESCDPTVRTTIQFYSRSWILTLGIPMYHTGVIATYDLSDNLTVNAGVTRGWDQALEDNNDAIDFLGSVNYVVSPNVTLYGALSIGPQQPDNSEDWRTLLNGTIYYTPDKNGPWIFALDAIIGWENNQVGDGDHTRFFRTRSDTNSYAQDRDTPPTGDTAWFGIAGFAAYKLHPQVVAKARAEYFYDGDGTRWRLANNDDDAVRPRVTSTYQAAPMNDPFVRIGDHIQSVEFTLGLDLVPFPNDAKELLIRPEVRLDLADHDIFVNGEDHYQVTLAIDLLYKF